MNECKLENINISVNAEINNISLICSKFSGSLEMVNIKAVVNIQIERGYFALFDMITIVIKNLVFKLEVNSVEK